MKIKAPRIHIPRPKKAVVIIAISVIILAALGAYGYVSYATWRDLDTDSKQVSSGLKTAIDEALGAENDTLSPIIEMKKLTSDFQKQYSEAPCDVSPFIRWQTAIAQVKKIDEDCQARFASALKIIETFKPLTSFMEQEKKANDLFVATVEATKASTDYVAASASWKALADNAELSNTGNFQPVADKMKEVAVAISTHYTSLATAIKNEDKATFDTAVKNLQAAYASGEAIKTATTAERQTLVLNVADAYDKL